jgi:hypothetical protein
MADDVEKIILGDTAISAVDRSRRGFFGRRRDRQSPPPTHCENCGALLHGHWCAKCGQAAIDYRRSFRHVIGDVLDSFLNWDSKFFATIAWLIVRPWHLTNEFLKGRRVRYVHPLRLYLLGSILFFFVVNYGARSIHLDPSKLSQQERAEITADLDKENISPDVKARVRRALEAKGLKQPEEDNPPAPGSMATPQPIATASPSPSPTSSPASDAVGPLVQFDEPPSDSLGKWLEQRAKEKMGERGGKMALFLRTLFSNLPYMMLCCIPLFALVLKILYIRKRIFYIDHLVYALHIHTFAYTAIILIVLATFGLKHVMPVALAGVIVALLWLAFAVQIFLSIRRVYRQGWFVSVLKFLFGGVAYLVVLSVALAITFFITVALPTS